MNSEKSITYNDLVKNNWQDLLAIKKYKFNCKLSGNLRVHKKQKKNFEEQKQILEVEEDQEENVNQIFDENIPLVKKKKKEIVFLNQIQTFSLILLSFAVEYGFAIEMVFISPLFLKLDTPDILDQTIWLFPPIMNLLIYPFVRFYSECKDQGATLRLLSLRRAIIAFCILSVVGIGLLADTRSILFHLLSSDSSKKTAFHYNGCWIGNAIGYYLIVYYLIQCSCCIVLEDFVHPKRQDLINHYCTIADSFGKFVGFLVSSVLAFNFIYLNFDNFIENLSFAYLVGLVFIMVGFILILIAFPVRDKEQFKIDTYASPRPQLKLTIDSFLPGITLLGKVPNSMKILLVSHFLTCGSQLFISCYSTLWSGLTMLEDGPQQYNKTIINIVFDIGISWGSLALCMSAILHLLTTLLLQQINNFTFLKYIYIVVNILAGFSLLFTWVINEFYSIFITLPFWGISMAVLQEIPTKLVNDIESKVKKYIKLVLQLVEKDSMKGVLCQMLNITTFFSQVALLLFVPVLFSIFSTIDDISMSLFVSCIFSVFGSLLAFFLSND